jgi:hypothetical protein
MKKTMFFILMITLSLGLKATEVKSFNFTESGIFDFDANLSGEDKTQAQKRVDEVKELGTNHIVLNVRAKMIGPYSSDIIPLTGDVPVSQEARKMTALIRYIKAQGMTVGIRPIFFVVGPNGEFPYTEVRADGSEKAWWHGNIQPSNPTRWFDNFQRYLDRYITIARIARVEEFTIGAELYSMTVGIEDQWKEHPHGFPGQWLKLLDYVRSRLGDQVRLMYDINFTDDVDRSTGMARSGGELERWRYRLVDLAMSPDPEEQKIWQNLMDFWNGLDAIGIDMYRSLAFRDDVLPADYEELVSLLSERALSYANQLDITLLEISMYSQGVMPVILKEVGFRSVDKAFIDPFTYATATGPLNIAHQAAGYEGLFRGFWEPGFEWFSGIAFWDIPLNPAYHGEQDRGFSPLGKKQTQEVVKYYFLQ